MPTNPQCYSTYIRDKFDPNYRGWSYMRQWGSGNAAIEYARRLQDDCPHWDVKASKNTGEVLYEKDGVPKSNPTKGDDR